MRYGYLPLIDGVPARFDGEQLCYVDRKGGRFVAELVATRARVRSQIKRSQEYRLRMFAEPFKATEYSWVRVALPDTTTQLRSARKGAR